MMGWDMKNSSLTASHLLANKVNIHIDVLRVLVLNGVIEEVYDTEIITIHQRGFWDRKM